MSLINKIVKLAQADENIRAVILEGSLATNFQIDELSDYDVNIFSINYEHYLSSDRWMNQIRDVLIYQKEHFQFYDVTIPTRLVLFRDRKRVDFSFWHYNLLLEIIKGEKQYESYKNGYEVLVDKDRLMGKLKISDAAGFLISPPNYDDFLQTLYDFWFEAYSVAKYLSRKDFWYAKLNENRYIKDRLFRMMLWSHQATNKWQPNSMLHTDGKRFEKWGSPELIDAISQCFSSYEITDTWNSLFTMVKLFNRLARQLSFQLHFEYPYQIEKDVIDFLHHIKYC